MSSFKATHVIMSKSVHVLYATKFWGDLFNTAHTDGLVGLALVLPMGFS